MTDMNNTVSAVQGFLDDLVNTGAYAACARESHDTWKATKEAQGWIYGEQRDDAAKKNPLLVSFDQLPVDVQGQNSLTPYAVVNYFRTVHGDKNFEEFQGVLTAVVAQDRELHNIGEYVHSHFLAAQLAKGASVATRKDMGTYQSLTDDQRSWDTGSAKTVVKYLLEQTRKL